MTGDNANQSSLTDFNDKDTGTLSSSLEQQPPSPADEPSEFLSWLRDDSTPSPETAVECIPELIEQVRTSGYHRWNAASALNLVLKSVSPPLDQPELVTLLDNDQIKTSMLVQHLLRIYPREVPVFEYSLDLEFAEADELSHSDRMEVYRLLSRLPPDEGIYRLLKRVSETFDNGTVDVGSTKYPVGGFFHTYAMRCLKIYLNYPSHAPRDLAQNAITDKPWSALRVFAAQPEQAAEADLIDYITDELDSKHIPSIYRDGRVVQSLCTGYVQATESKTQKEIGNLLYATISSGVYPNHWINIIPQLVEEIRTGSVGQQAGKILAEVLDSVQHDVEEVLPIETIINELSANLSPWLSSLLVVAEKYPDLLDGYVSELVAIIRESEGRSRSRLCDVLAAVGKHSPTIVLPEIDPVVQDLGRANSAQEVDDIGRILQALEVYPPPPQLKNLYGSTDDAIDSKAKEVVAALEQQFSDSSSELEIEEVDTIQVLADEYNVVQRTGAVTWEQPSLGSSELLVITSVARIATSAGDAEDVQDKRLLAVLRDLLDERQINLGNNNPSIQYVFPSHDSAWVEYAVMGAMFAQIINPSTRVVLHTPATGGWGTKKDVREALSQYGLSPADNSTSEVIPLLDLVPLARITDGEVTVQTSRTTISDDPSFLTLVRDLKSLRQSSADIILYNYLPGISASDAAQIQQWRGDLTESQSSRQKSTSTRDDSLVTDGPGEIADHVSLSNLVQVDDVEPEEFSSTHPDNPAHVELYGIFAAQYAMDRRQHIGPPTDLPAPYLVGREHRNHSQEGDDCVLTSGGVQSAAQLITGPSSVELYAVKSGADIGGLLSRLDDYINQVSDSNSVRALQSIRYTLGSLPVPVDLHDSWIRDQIDLGNRWVPRRMYNRRNNIQELADDAAFDAQLLDEALATIDTLLERLDKSNPLFEELLNILDEAAADNKCVGILCEKKTYKEMLDIYLRKRAGDWVLGDDLQLVDEDTVRQLSPNDVDWLITFDPLPPQTAIYYHHPAVEKVLVLGHPDGTLSSRLHGVEQKRRPFLPRRTDSELPELDVTVRGTELNPDSQEQNLTDDLYRTYLSVAAQSRDDDSTGGSRSSTGRRQYQVTFEETEPVTLSDTHPVIVRSEAHLVTAGEYVPRSVPRLSKGDEIVQIDSETRADLWEEFLREDWETGEEDEVDTEEAFMDAVELWYDAVMKGLEEHSETDDLTDGIRSFAQEIESDTSVMTETIVDWARSVYRADSPSDLIFRSGLRIGPRHSDGIQAVGEAYGSERMANNWEQVFTRIKTIRATHRQRGSVFWEWLADRACSGELFDRPRVTQLTVTQVREVE